MRASPAPLPVSEGGWGLVFGRGGADGEKLSAGLTTPLTNPAKLGMLASELKMLSKLGAGAGVVEGAGLSTAVSALAPGGIGLNDARLASVLAVSAKSGIWVVMLLAMLSKEGGAEGVEGFQGAEPPMEAATPASDGMLVAITPVTPSRVGKVRLRLSALRASSSEEDT